MMKDDEWDHELIYEKAEDKLERCNAVRDTPWAVLYDWLDETHPDARFILTVRDCREWVSSMKRHFAYRRLPAFTYMFGHPEVEGHEERFKRRFNQHNMGAVGWFAGREHKLLVMNLSVHGWPELCEFLDQDCPDEPFPHLNSTAEAIAKGET